MQALHTFKVRVVMAMLKRCALGLSFVAVGACTDNGASSGSDTAAATTGDSAAAIANAMPAVACFRATSSILGRERPLRGASSPSPGYLRIERDTRADTGMVLLVDADGATMRGTWTRATVDSLRIVAFDDFLRVSMTVSRSDTSLNGNGLATSDAELVRDSTGQMRELRREWRVAARPIPCDSLPRTSAPGNDG